jgi:predicted RNA-binding protein YlqC (UPF0109 family)
MKNLIKLIAQALVDNPKHVSVKEIKGEYASVFELRVADVDIGKVIGKNGRTASAMRIIINASSAKKNVRSILEIID